MAVSPLSFVLMTLFASLLLWTILVYVFRRDAKGSSKNLDDGTASSPVESLISIVDGAYLLADLDNRVVTTTANMAAALKSPPHILNGMALELLLDKEPSTISGASLKRGEIGMLDINGGIAPISVTHVPLHDDEGVRIGTLLQGQRTDGSSAELKPRWESLLELQTRDLEAKKRELEASGAQLQELVERIGTIKDQEGVRISRVLREELTGILSQIKANVTRLHDALGPQFEPRVSSVLSVINTALGHVDKIIDGIRPPMLDRVGLGAAIETAKENFEKVHHISCDTRLSIAEEHIGVDMATAIFKIVQESLTNIARHARASKARVSLSEDGDGIKLTIEDNGRGVTSEALNSERALGVLGMQERAKAFGGSLDVSPGPSGGTAVRMTIPFQR